jgi:hypothetical protein
MPLSFEIIDLFSFSKFLCRYQEAKGTKNDDLNEIPSRKVKSISVNFVLL